jgi:hypothetical protein
MNTGGLSVGIWGFFDNCPQMNADERRWVIGWDLGLMMMFADGLSVGD